MDAVMMAPIREVRGKLTDEHYARVLNGRQIIQKKPRKSSALQTALRESFGRRFGTARKKK